MKAIFKEQIQALENTVWIGKRCNVELDFNTLHLPNMISQRLY